MSITTVLVILAVLLLFFLAVGKAFTMWITGIDLVIKNQKEIIGLLNEIADNTAPPVDRVQPPNLLQGKRALPK